MKPQSANPLSYRSSRTSPDCVADSNFKSWLAYVMMECWLGEDSSDPDPHGIFPRPWNENDVGCLRRQLLDVVETTIYAIWSRSVKPGDPVDQDPQCVAICSHDPEDEESEDDGDEVNVYWYVDLHEDAIMFALYAGSAPVEIYLNYQALNNKQVVIDALKEAWATLSVKDSVWCKLLEFDETNIPQYDFSGEEKQYE